MKALKIQSLLKIFREINSWCFTIKQLVSRNFCHNCNLWFNEPCFSNFSWNQFREQLQLDRHISRISRENEKWFCETFLARNAAREIARKIGQFLAILDPNLAKIQAIFNVELPILSWKFYTNLYLMTLWTKNHITMYQL